MAVKERPAEIKSGDVLRGTYELKYAQHVFMARVAQGRAEFYFSGQKEPFGFIRPGSATTGAIWLGDECIGEYEQQSKQAGTVTLIVDGRRQPESVVEIDPITFLLQQGIERVERPTRR